MNQQFTSPAKRDELDIKYRPPVVTILGHVDHGKTTLLDAIRKTNIVAREHGGITQHIGAYQITHNSKLITFIDTPGHAAFEKMRSRGAEVADIIILVVAANDGVKPQTVEAIKHIKNAKKPVVVAITKVDLPDINIEKAKKELQAQNIIVESYGGDIPLVEVAATIGRGIDDLLEVIQLIWQLAPEQSNPQNPLQAVVVESFLDKNRGPVVTAIPKTGTLTVGQKITVDSDAITIRALIDDNGKNVSYAPPSKPVEILGFKKLLNVGSIINDRMNVQIPLKPQLSVTHADIIAKSEEAKNKFKIILKADVAGSLEAILENLPANILVLTSSVGEISQRDIEFAKTASAPIISFNLKTPNLINNLADREGIVIKNYSVIYELLKDMEDVAVHFEQAKQQAKVLGRAKIVATFEVKGVKIAGSKVTQGKFQLSDQVILVRGAKELGEAKIASLKRFKKDYSSVSAGQDCGIQLSPTLDFTEGDVIESYGPKNP